MNNVLKKRGGKNMPWIRLRNNRLLYLTKEYKGQLMTDFANLQGWNQMEMAEKFYIEGGSSKKEDQAFYDFQEQRILQHFADKDKVYEDLNINYFFDDKAKKEIYDWLHAFCQTHNNVRLGKKKSSQFYIPNRVDIDLSIVYGNSFYLFQTQEVKNICNVITEITGAYGIDVDTLVAIIGSLDSFSLYFENDLIYNIRAFTSLKKQIIQIEVLRIPGFENLVINDLKKKRGL